MRLTQHRRHFIDGREVREQYLFREYKKEMSRCCEIGPYFQFCRRDRREKHLIHEIVRPGSWRVNVRITWEETH
jgi:hypothetical protein